MTSPGTIVTCPRCATRNRIRPTPTGVPRCSVCQTLLAWIVEASADTFDEEITSSLPVLVDFWAPWCGPCRVVSPLVEQIAKDLPGKIKLVKVNTDDAPNLSQRFGIRGIPTLILFDHGKPAARVTGALAAPALRSWVEEHLPRAAAKP